MLLQVKLTPSETARSEGLDSFAEMVKLSGMSENTLLNWFKKKPHSFVIVAKGCYSAKNSAS